MLNKLISRKMIRSNFVQEDAVVYPLDWNSWRKVAANELLPTAGDATSLGLVVSMFGTLTYAFTSTSYNNTAGNEAARCSFVLPAEYVAGESVTIRVRGKVTTVFVASAEVDLVCHKQNRAGGIGGDLCTTAAQSINSTSTADKDFVITPTDLAPGDTLDLRLNAIGDDTGGSMGTTISIYAVELLLDIKG